MSAFWVQIEMAIRQALGRGLATRSRLRRSAGSRPERVRRFVERAMEAVPA